MVKRVTPGCDAQYRGKPCPEEPVEYRIVTPEGTWEVDLCPRHADPLVAAMALGRKESPAKRKRRKYSHTNVQI